MKPIRVTLWRRCPGGWEPGKQFLAPSWSKARRAAKVALGPLYTTDALYHQDVGNGDFASLARSTRDIHPPRHFVDPEVIVEPSVGERGVW